MKKHEINQVVQEMTLEEKINLIHGVGLFKSGSVDRLNIPSFIMADGPMGVRIDLENDKWVAIDQNYDFVTYLPSGTTIASSWNLELAKLYGDVLGKEARGRGKDIILAPSINIKRSPLNGRNFEYLSEDPYLTSKFAVEMIKAIQKNDVASCVKHFAANNQETERLKVDVIVSQKALNEIYYPAFKASVKDANTYSIMGAYNKINGAYASQSYHLLNEVLRNKWGFEGIVVSDWSAVNNSLEAANSGIDIEMSVHSNFDEYYMANPLKKLVLEKKVDESLIDFKVKNILSVMAKLKMIGGKKGDRLSGSYNTLEHQQSTYDIASEGIVLLKNKDLPLKQKLNKILVIGDNAIRHHSSGGGSAEIKALYEVSPLMALKMRLGGNVEIKYVKGYYVDDFNSQNENWQETSLESKDSSKKIEYSKQILQKQNELREEAVNLAKEYENIIIFGGLNHNYDLEGQDRNNLDLPYNQSQLIKEVLSVNKKAIVHILAGSTVDIRDWHHLANNILYSSYSGMLGNLALIDIILGNINPSGKLTETWAKELSNYPSHSVGNFPGLKEVHYKEDVFVGYRHFIKEKIEPFFSFGHGLSYSSFIFDNFDYKINDEELILDFTIKNNSEIDGKEVVQVYASNHKYTNDLPILKAFKKIEVKANELIKSSITLNLGDLEFYNEDTGNMEIKKGEFNIYIGNSIDNFFFNFTIKI